MLINLRNALMAGKRLPYDNEIEFLESTRTQWIDTGINAKQSLKIRAVFETNSTTSQFAYGVRAGDSTISCSTGVGTSVGIARWGTSAYASVVPSGLVDITQDSSGVMVNGNSHRYNATQTVVEQSGYTMVLFAGRNSSTTVTANMVGKFYSCKIWDNGILVRDLIPVRKGTVGAVYDRRGVGGMNPDGSPRNDGMYFNRGTGDFVLGPDVVPVEWLGSYGYQYIDTGTIPDDKTGIEVVHTICPNNGIDNIIFGARQDSGNTRYWCDIDWGGAGSIGWGFNTYSDGSDRFALSSSDAGRVITNSLNYMNDRAGKIDGVTYDSSLQNKTLATLSRSIYLFGANNQGTVGIRGIFKVYSAKISKGQTLANKFLPVRVGSGSTWEGAMMDVLTRRIYRNAGTGAFSYGNDLKYPIPA